MPPYLAGREEEKSEFQRLLDQRPILVNMILTGRRGVGKTVLLDTLKPLAMQNGWLWVGADLSETASISEETIATRMITDLSVVTSNIVVSESEIQKFGFTAPKEKVKRTLDFNLLVQIYQSTPGLVIDKLKAVLEQVWLHLSKENARGVIFAYDEAQNLSDHAGEKQFPLSLLLDTFQSIQKKGIPFMLVLTGLPNLFPKLVEARTFAERMFRVVEIDRLKEAASKQAIMKPVEDADCPLKLSTQSVKTIVVMSGGYPYFIQFICREVYDLFIQQVSAGQNASVPVDAITRKLDTDFFAGRWSRATDRQRDLLMAISTLDNCDNEFTVQDAVEASKKVMFKQGFNRSHANQMLTSLCDAGLVFKSRHGKYSLGVPLLSKFIRRQMEPGQLSLGLPGT
jgi:hypothetical protein